MRLKKRLINFMNYWPPFFGAGIKVRKISEDFREIDVEMKLSPLNSNYVGTHFGGSLYSMTDPFYMLMVLENIGNEYIVWDKAANIRFLKPGRGKVRAEFRLDPARIDEIKKALETQTKYEPVFEIAIKDEEGDVVAKVEKTLYVRKKAPKKAD